jgi:hypothetical protein
MVNIPEIIQSSQEITDKQGNRFVVVPKEMWDSILEALEPPEDQAARIEAVLDSWDQEPDDTPPGWWDEFREFLRENRLNFGERDSKKDRT